MKKSGSLIPDKTADECERPHPARAPRPTAPVC
jgi:hypothetical protein